MAKQIMCQVIEIAGDYDPTVSNVDKIQTRVQSFEQREVLLQAIFREFIAEIAL